MSNKNLTKTLFADFRKVDTKKLNINGNPFSKVVTDNVPETPTENDIWKYVVTTDDNGVVTVTDDITVDYTEITDAQKAITKTAVKVIDNKVLDANDVVLMNWDTKNFTNENNSVMLSVFGGSMSQRAPITEWNSDLSSLTDGTVMFAYTTLQSFSGDLSNLIDGDSMLGFTRLTSFDSDLPSLTTGYGMFYLTPLESFNGDLSSLTDGRDMFKRTSLQSFNCDLPSLTNGETMFYWTPLQSFDGDLSSLTNGNCMFTKSALASFNSDLSSLTDGGSMFSGTALESFSGDLSSLTYGGGMFSGTALQSFSGDLSSLANGDCMFTKSALQSFSGDLSNMVYGYRMFANNQPRHYGLAYFKMVDGVKKEVTETVVSNGLKSFISNLSSLKSGYRMFGSGDDIEYTYTDDSGSKVPETTKDVAPLDEESIMLIADTINDISSLNKTVDSDWTYTYYNSNGSLTTKTISSNYRGILHLGYDSSITDTTNINAYCDQIAAKGWTVYLNGSEYVSTNSDSASLIDGESSTTPIPHYYKPVQVTDEEIAEYVDGNGNYYIIIGGQRVFGDNISTYGIFTSYQHAIQEITTGLGLSKYEKPSTETTNN